MKKSNEIDPNNPKDRRNWSMSAMIKHICRKRGMMMIDYRIRKMPPEYLTGLPFP